MKIKNHKIKINPLDFGKINNTKNMLNYFYKKMKSWNSCDDFLQKDGFIVVYQKPICDREFSNVSYRDIYKEILKTLEASKAENFIIDSIGIRKDFNKMVLKVVILTDVEVFFTKEDYENKIKYEVLKNEVLKKKIAYHNAVYALEKFSQKTNIKIQDGVIQ